MFAQFLGYVLSDLKLFLLAPIFCAIFRYLFLGIYGHLWRPDAGEGEAYLRTFYYGFWWGLDFNAYAFLLPVLCISLPALFFPGLAALSDSLRAGFITGYLFLLYLAFIGKMIFYYHFHDTFNQTLWLGFEGGLRPSPELMERA